MRESPAKQWFVSEGGEQHGPYSWDELRAHARGGVSGREPLVWSPGMSDWEALERIERAPPGASAGAAQEVRWSHAHPALRAPVPWKRAEPRPQRVAAARGERVLGRVGALLLSISLGLAFIGYGKKTDSGTAPRIVRDVSLVREARGIVAELKTSLPSGTRFGVELQGIPDTLVGSVRASANAELVTQAGFGRTQPLRQADGSELPQGEYEIRAFELQGPVETPRIRFTRVVSIGARDRLYSEALAAFHEQLRRKSVVELADLRQTAEALEAQLSETELRFQEFARLSQPARSRVWDRFSASWNSFQKDVGQDLNDQSPDTLFHAELFRLSTEAEALVRRVHQAQARWVGSFRDAALELEIAEATSIARSTILALKSRIELSRKLPDTERGMPGRLASN